MPKDTEGKQKYGHTTPYQLRAMVEWIEVEENCSIIKGESTNGKAMKHGAGVTRIRGFAMMAEYVFKAAKKYAKAAGKLNERYLHQWPADTCQSRWKSTYKRYMTTRDKVKNQTGFGISDAMLKAGITFEDMVEKSCPLYHRIDAVVGKESNVEPASQQHEPILSDDDDDDRESYSGQNFGAVSSDEDEDASVVELLAQVEAVEGPASVSTAPAIPALASQVRPTTERSAAEERGVTKVKEAKRKDFGSVYVEAAGDRLRFEEKRLQLEMDWRERQHELDSHLRQEELRLKAKQQRDVLVLKREEERNKLILQLLQSGMAIELVKTTVDSFFPPPGGQEGVV